MVARSLQGAISQFAWSVGLALAVSLPPCAGVAATAWAMTGNSVGEGNSEMRADRCMNPDPDPDPNPGPDH
eukprot:scaffold13116_cov62-Phaeocystis_antarctica.AAC.5